MTAVVESSHKRFLAIPTAFKECVSTREARAEGGKNLEYSLSYFNNRLREVEQETVDSSKIVQFLVTPDDGNDRLNFFVEAKTQRIRTAVVQCNFTDSEMLMRSVERNCKENRVDRVIVSSHSTGVQGVMEELAENTRHSIILIEQLESLDAAVFNNLIALLNFHQFNVSLLICISTSRSVLYSHCSRDNARLLQLEFFPLTPPQEQFELLAAALTRNADEKAPNLFLSAELSSLLKRRFLQGDFSISEMFKIVRLSIVENFLRYDSYVEDEDDDDFPARLPAYWHWLDTLYETIEMVYEDFGLARKTVPHRLDVHAELQHDPAAFWRSYTPVEKLHSWMSQMNGPELCEILDSLAVRVGVFSEEDAELINEQLQKLREESEQAAAAAATAAQAPPTPTTAAAAPKMTMQQLLRATRDKQAAQAAKGNLRKDAIRAVMGLMRERLFEWRQHEHYLLMVPEGYEVPDLSRNLATRTDQTLSHAFAALARIDQFKAVSMPSWGAVVADRIENGEFYDRVAQLERMGVIKDMSKQRKNAVMVQLRPLINFN